MAKLSKKEFAEACGLKTKDLAVYIGRKKVIVKGDVIDTGNPVNSDFLRRQQDKKQGERHDQREVTEPRIPNEAITGPPAKGKQKASADESGYALIKKKTQIQIEKLENENELLKLRIEKQTGEAIPTDLVKSAITQLSKSVVSSFQNGAEDILVQISKVKNMNREELAGLRGKLKIIINAAVQEAVKDAKKQITNIVAEYSEKKGVGEHS
jgi:hypothetical protein